jgi:hypothetical protein
MQKLSKKKFELKCQELGVGANQSLFFKSGFFTKFGCNSFRSVNNVATSAITAEKLQTNFRLLCIKYEEYLKKSSSVVIHFMIEESFPFMVAQEMMQAVHKYFEEECDVAISVQYHQTVEVKQESVYLFFEEKK